MSPAAAISAIFAKQSGPPHISAAVGGGGNAAAVISMSDCSAVSIAASSCSKLHDDGRGKGGGLSATAEGRQAGSDSLWMRWAVLCSAASAASTHHKPPPGPLQVVDLQAGLHQGLRQGGGGGGGSECTESKQARGYETTLPLHTLPPAHIGALGHNSQSDAPHRRAARQEAGAARPSLS